LQISPHGRQATVARIKTLARRWRQFFFASTSCGAPMPPSARSGLVGRDAHLWRANSGQATHEPKIPPPARPSPAHFGPVFNPRSHRGRADANVPQLSRAAAI